MSQPLSRRAVLRSATALGITPLGLLSACGDSAPVCMDPGLLGAGEAQMRKTLQYTNLADDETQNCKVCQFFRTEHAPCGECEILGGPVAQTGHCTSWAQQKY